jgi:hypothetical protein
MKTEEMINIYLDLIRKNKHHEENIVSKIMLKHKMIPDASMVTTLSFYYDHLTAIDENNDLWVHEHNHKYNITEHDQQYNDDLWNQLEHDMIQDGLIQGGIV